MNLEYFPSDDAPTVAEAAEAEAAEAEVEVAADIIIYVIHTTPRQAGRQYTLFSTLRCVVYSLVAKLGDHGTF